MSLLPKSRSYSRRSVGVMLVVGVLAGLTVGGGVGVIAAASTKTVTVCANKKTNMLRYAKNGKCVTKTETKVVVNQTGAKGAKGTNGTAGAAGTNGTNGADGADGTSSPTGFTARSVCGSDGTTLCAVGEQGPGGGTIVYVDSTNEMPMYDYLEVAPEDASTGVAWSTNIESCGTDVDYDCQESFLSDLGSALNYLLLGTGRSATTAIVIRHSIFSVALASSYAAGVADAYTTATAADWFLPSIFELNEVCKYARNTGQAAGTTEWCNGGDLRLGFASGVYWSSSEFDDDTACVQNFASGALEGYSKLSALYVRPVRGF